MKDKISNIIDLIKVISDLKFQQEVWINQKFWNRALNFGETVNLLDDYSFFDFVEMGELQMVDPDIQVVLQKLSSELLNYEEPYNIENIITDKKWLNIVEMAKLVYEDLIKDKMVISSKS